MSSRGGSSSSGSDDAAFAQQAIPFLQPDADGKFHVSPDAARILSKVKGKIVVVAVAGPYRTGKSYLLNCLIDSNVSSGFKVGSTVNACTKGIWLWGAPKYDPETGRTYIFLDTEGLNSAGENVTYDTQIFALSVLLSSMFIFNTQNAITEAALQELELVAESSKMIRFKDDDSKAAAAAAAPDQGKKRGSAAPDQEAKRDTIDREVAEHFPSFIWVLRDFTLLLEDKTGRPITPDEYLENMLSPVPTGIRGAEEKNRVRETIRSCFLRRSCVPLVRPVESEEQLRSLASLPKNKLRSEFVQGLEDLKARVHDPSNTLVKRIGDSYVSGPLLVELAQTYANAINSGHVPAIMSAWQSALKIRSLAALDAAKQSYDRKVEEFFAAHTAEAKQAGASATTARGRIKPKSSTADVVVFDESKIHQAHNEALTFAKDELAEALLNNHDAYQETARRLEEYAQQALEQRLKLNMERSYGLCKTIASEMWADSREDAVFSASALSKRIRGSLDDGKPFGSAEWTEFCEHFLTELQARGARGPALASYEHELALLICGHTCDTLSTCTLEIREEYEQLHSEFEEFQAKSAEAQKELQRQIDEEKKDSAKIKQQLSEVEVRAKSLELALATRTEELKTFREEMTKRLDAQTEELRRADRERAVAEAELKRETKEKVANERLLKVAHDENQELKDEALRLKNEVARLKGQLEDAKQSRSSQLTSMERKLEEALQAAEQSNEAAIAAQSELKLAKAEIAKLVSEERASTTEVSKLNAELRKERQQNSRLAKELEDLRRNLDLAQELQDSTKKRAAEAERAQCRVEAELDDLKREVQEKAKQLDQAQFRIQELEQRLAELRANAPLTTPIGTKRKSWRTDEFIEPMQQDLDEEEATDYVRELPRASARPSFYESTTSAAAAPPPPQAPTSATRGSARGKKSATSSTAAPLDFGWEVPVSTLNDAEPAPQPKTKRVQRASMAPQVEDDGFAAAAARVPVYYSPDDLPAYAQEYNDPERCTTTQLRAWLTSIDIPIPPTVKTKADLVKMVKKHDPRCW